MSSLFGIDPRAVLEQDARRIDHDAVCLGYVHVRVRTMESNSGKATVAPTPRKKVRRARCRFVNSIAERQRNTVIYG
jgi:hypothetical protein